MTEYINREEILMELAEAYDEIDPRFSRGRAIKEAIVIIKNRINAIPAAEVAPVVHARWIMRQFGRGVCSNCHRQDEIDPLATHCRYCGAKMDGE